MTKINKKRVRLLVEALRSGRFAQGRGALGRTSGGVSYCCLGVACEVAKAHGLELEESGTHTMAFDGNDTSLPRSVREWYGFQGSDPALRFGELFSSAITLNDANRLDFSQIADAFEQTYLAGDDD